MYFQGRVWRRVSQQIQKSIAQAPNIHENRIVVAVSGGIDSVFMLHALNQLSKKYKWDLAPAYIHHHLLPEDELYGRLAQITAKKMGKDCQTIHSRKARPPKTNLEEWLREERYRLLEIFRKKAMASYIAIAHHRLDQAETVLAHIIRGTGFRGLRGMLPVRGKIIRPLIYCSKKDIEFLMLSTNLPYYNDKLNYLKDYQRNKIRHNLIPYLEKNFNPQITARLAKLAEIARKDNDSEISKLKSQNEELKY